MHRFRRQNTTRHRLRNALMVAGGVALVAAAVPAVRAAVRSFARRRQDWAPTTIAEEIEVAVPVTAAYTRWTQFEEFPRFMEGVDEVRRLDDSLFHWAATVAGRHAEWDAKIVEQEPDRRIAWESVDGKRTRGTVTFEPAGPERSRIRLHMSYVPDGAAEEAGSALGLDHHRVRGDLERFRELVETHG